MPNRHVENGWPTPSAFQLRPVDKGTLSVNWLECFTDQSVVVAREDREAPIEEIRRVIQIDRSYQGLFAVLNVELLKQAIETGGGQSPYVEHDPQGPKPAEGRRPKKPPDPSHALVHGYPVADLDVAVQLLALVSKTDVFPGRIRSAVEE